MIRRIIFQSKVVIILLFEFQKVKVVLDQHLLKGFMDESKLVSLLYNFLYEKKRNGFTVCDSFFINKSMK